MRDLIYILVVLLLGDLLGIYCRVDHVMIAMNILSIRIMFLYLYIYYFGGVFRWFMLIHKCCYCSYNDYRSRKYQTKR